MILKQFKFSSDGKRNSRTDKTVLKYFYDVRKGKILWNSEHVMRKWAFAISFVFGIFGLLIFFQGVTVIDKKLAEVSMNGRSVIGVSSFFEIVTCLFSILSDIQAGQLFGSCPIIILWYYPMSWCGKIFRGGQVMFFMKTDWKARWNPD